MRAGQPVLGWIALASKKKKADPYTALKKIGPNALPYAVRNLVRNDSRWRGGYKNLWSKFPKRLQQIMPQLKPNLQVVDGANVFFSIGPDAIPYAIALLKHESSTVRQSAAWGLCALRRKTPAADQAIPALTEALADPDEMVRVYALLALWKSDPPPATQCLPLPRCWPRRKRTLCSTCEPMPPWLLARSDPQPEARSQP